MMRGAPFLLLILAACPIRAKAAEVDKYLPDRTETIFVCNVHQIVDSSVFQKFFRAPLTDAAARQGEDRPAYSLLSPDVLKSISRITVALPPGVAERKGMVIVHGRFDLARFQKIAEAFAQNTLITLKIHPADKVPLYEVLIDDPPTADVFAAFPEKEVLVVSPSRDAVLDAIAVGAGRRAAKLNPDLVALLRKMDMTQSIWVAGRLSEQARASLERRPQLKAFAGKIESFSGGIRFADDIVAGLHVQMSDAQAAADFKHTLDVSKTLIQVVISTNADLKDYVPVLNDVLTALQFTQQKATVGLEVTLPENLIAKGVQVKAGS